jgi:hypothetical protein
LTQHVQKGARETAPPFFAVSLSPVIRTAFVAWAVALGLSCSAFSAQASATSHASLMTKCSATGISAKTDYKLVGLEATKLSCTKALSLTRTIVKELQANGVVTLPDSTTFTMSTSSCTGCGTTTEIAFSFSSGGKVALALRAASPPPQPGSSTTV